MLVRQNSSYELINGALTSSVERIKSMKAGISKPSLKKMDIYDEDGIYHELRIIAFRQELDTFIDAITTEQAMQACEQHTMRVQDYEDEKLMYEKVLMVKNNELKAEDIGMMPEDIEKFNEPICSTADQYFAQELQANSQLE